LTIAPGRVSVGPAVSCTVTVKLDDEGLPRVSPAEQLIVFVPNGGTQVTGRVPSTASLAVGAA
jgi:hypothetical protein